MGAILGLKVLQAGAKRCGQRLEKSRQPLVNETCDAHFPRPGRLIGRNDLRDDRIDGTRFTWAEEAPFGAPLRFGGRGMHAQGPGQCNGCRDSEARLEQRAARVAGFDVVTIRHVALQRWPSYRRNAGTTTAKSSAWHKSRHGSDAAHPNTSAPPRD